MKFRTETKPFLFLGITAIFVLIVLWSHLGSHNVRAAQPRARAQTQAQTQKKSARHPSLVWDHWYTVTVEPDHPYGYYHEVATPKDGRVLFRTEQWNREDGVIWEQQVGVLAKDTPLLEPLFFNLRNARAGKELQVDGNVSGTLLTAKVRSGNLESPTYQRSLPKNSIFLGIFPLWLSRKLTEIKANPKKEFSFTLVPEDEDSTSFAPLIGFARLESTDAFAQSSKSTRIKVHVRSTDYFWYLDDQGVPIRIVIPAQRTVADLVPEKAAREFFERNPVKSEQ